MLLNFLAAMFILSACDKESVVPEGKLQDEAQGLYHCISLTRASARSLNTEMAYRWTMK
ncbi:hypothetical protein WJR50_31465 [Catalinimonas sp. 4WD22]|uniref:hypothetical protein n=1 Tax=Catalinimonas locisalis TaxID=3133978 RepID=UPI003100CB8E